MHMLITDAQRLQDLMAALNLEITNTVLATDKYQSHKSSTQVTTPSTGASIANPHRRYLQTTNENTAPATKKLIANATCALASYPLSSMQTAGPIPPDQLPLFH